jgi:hypothetical protein
MKCVRKIGFLGIVLGAMMASGQTSRSSYDPAANRPAKQHDSFMDFALKKVNPQDIDYGQGIEEMRRTAIVATMDDCYYWSNLVAISGLVIMFCLFFRQHVLLKRRASSTARVVTWYHNELLEARSQAFEQGAKYLQLKRRTDDQIEAGLTQNPQPPKGGSTSGEPSGGSGSSVNGAAANTPTQSEQTLREAIKKLEQQAGKDKETINSLRQQTGVLSRRLQEEQQKNRSLRGDNANLGKERTESHG